MLYFICAGIIDAQHAQAENLIPYPDGKGKWGYCDSTSKIIIKPQYDFAWYFKNGTAAVLKNEYTVFISTDGTELFRGRWQSAGMTDAYGLPVKLRGKWGFADKTGELIFPAEYDEFYNFSADIAPAKKDGTWGFVDIKTKEFMPCACDEIMPFSEGMAVFIRDGKYGMFDDKGKEAVPPAYEELYSFSGNFATARLNGTYGFLTNEQFFKARNYIRIWPYSHGLAAAASLQSDNKCGYIDDSGTLKVPFAYAECLPFSEGKAAVRKKSDGKWGYIDESGKEITPFRYDRANQFVNGAAWTIINQKGIWINPEGRPYDKFYNLKKIQDKR